MCALPAAGVVTHPHCGHLPTVLPAPPAALASNTYSTLRDKPVSEQVPSGPAAISFLSAVGPSGVITSTCSQPTTGPCPLAAGEGSVSITTLVNGSTIVWTPTNGNSQVAMTGNIVIVYAATDNRGAQTFGTLTINRKWCGCKMYQAVNCRPVAPRGIR
jgi:hypothetical protein